MSELLLIEDDPIMGESLVQRFEIEGYTLHWCRRLGEAAALLDAPRRWAAVVSDVRLPDGMASTWFRAQPAPVRRLPWFFLTGYGSVDDAVVAMRAGAREYLTKPFDIERLVMSVRNATASGDADDGVVLGISSAMRRIESLLRKVAPQKAPIMLTGESGVGKEVAARLVHDVAGRGDFVAVNCAAIPETMLEAEFFGYEKGAFTGAARVHRGYLERASGGTLFLDEVGELPLSMQAKLLRALQERSFFRLGSEKPTSSDFRLVSATNRDLLAAMADGRFREDLFYRIAVIRVDLPALRERPEDVRWLAQRMLAQMAIEQQRTLAMSDDFLCTLMTRPWRGNARELRAMLEQAVALSETGWLDTPAHEGPPDVVGMAEGALLQPLQRVLEDTERQHIRRALQMAQGSVGRTAEMLGISRKTLWEKMRRLGLST
ncbi:sigma-54-dependent transcriptional regulator [Tepidimonas sp.]|uniref:sigma-54-dependent transcriptional regulator n=1 Tax=Tepidimonas sp. TaxID=2002775 RepID=UPI00391AAD06